MQRHNTLHSTSLRENNIIKMLKCWAVLSVGSSLQAVHLLALCREQCFYISEWRTEGPPWMLGLQTHSQREWEGGRRRNRGTPFLEEKEQSCVKERQATDKLKLIRARYIYDLNICNMNSHMHMFRLFTIPAWVYNHDRFLFSVLCMWCSVNSP